MAGGSSVPYSPYGTVASWPGGAPIPFALFGGAKTRSRRSKRVAKRTVKRTVKKSRRSRSRR